jgi:tRNA U34 5-methylaminomethyl-2-thiouridine-forming methyltransferase MnmC
MQKSTIIWDENQNPISPHFQDVYFNTKGAIDETTYVFIDGNDLQQRFYNHNKETFIVAETGFGSGLNFLLLWQTFLNFTKKFPNHKLKKLKFFSVEKFPLSAEQLVKIHNNIINKHSPLALLAEQLQISLIDSTIHFNNVTLTICYNDISYFGEFLMKQKVMVNAWFFDGFSPAKNPDMWSKSLFQNCYKLTALNGTFATFTAAGFVRRNLLEAGFKVYKRKGFGIKREMLIGFKSE